MERFAGRPDVFALWVPPLEWLEDHVQETLHRIDVPEGEFGLTAAQAHLLGEAFLGVYPIWSDSTVQFFALDFDKSPEEAWKEALHQQKMFENEAGIATYIERSRSGNGYHLWGFLEEPVNAGELRHALAQFIPAQSTFDRMFPNQDSVSETRPLGNLIALQT